MVTVIGQGMYVPGLLFFLVSRHSASGMGGIHVGLGV